ncbi:MAG: sialate O-acetylesterase, partial [Acidobacteriaceae bacterium]
GTADPGFCLAEKQGGPVKHHRIFWALSASFFLLVPAWSGVASPAQSATDSLPFVSPIFADNMVLQRNKENTIWGWSDPGDTVRVRIGDKTASGTASENHRWQVRIHPPAAGGPYTVSITGHRTIELRNVLVGDVWLCGGQSNMVFSLHGALNGDEEVKKANYPDIRFFTVAQHAAYHAAEIPNGSWQVVSADTAGRLSAVAYYFARRVQQDIHVPIGLVVDAVGGTPAETWTSAAGLRSLKLYDEPLAELARLTAQNGPAYGNYVMHWYDQYDLGLKGDWDEPGLSDTSWKTVTLQNAFEVLDVSDTPVVVWFRKEITLPNPVPAGRAMLYLGVVDRMDTAYVNGKEVGSSAWVENPRAYTIPPDLLKPGRNVVAIRVFKTKSPGGFLSKPEEIHLALGEKTNIPLTGTWKAEIGIDARPPHPLPLSYENWPVVPSVLYEGMLAPVAPLSITGAIWYQGEANAVRGYEYRKVLPVMIADWRKLFAQGDFPFYVVSLPAFKQRSNAPEDGDEWAEIRESQAITAAAVSHSCLAVTIDTGESGNIHPKDKTAVGGRLAFCALAKYYDKKIAYAGPTVTKVDRPAGAIRLHYAHTDGGLVSKGPLVDEFQIAGEDRKWVWADARIHGDTILVSSPRVPHPKEVRYAWQANPPATLYNEAGLPAVPFRSDKWPAVSEGHRPY